MTRAEVQEIASLRERKGRDASGKFVIEGPKAIGDLLRARYPLEALYATPAWADRPAGVAVTEVTDAEMERMSNLPTPSAVLAVARIVRRNLPAGALDHGLTLALDGIQDPGNVGTLLRVADWFGLERVLLSPGCADLHSPKVIAASMASFARVAAYVIDLPAALSGVRVPVLGCDLTGEDIHCLPPLSDAVIVVGSEGQGISPATAQAVTRRVTIPKHGHAESLNAAIAAAIVCDNLRRG